MVGWVQMQVRGPAGTTITLRHAEVLDQQGNLYTENLRAADQITRYTLKGLPDADELFEPHFTFQGFRYVAVEGFPGEPEPGNFTAVVLHSDTTPTGTFECSHPPSRAISIAAELKRVGQRFCRWRNLKDAPTCQTSAPVV
jgi:alpha-L-rhamnosidase